MAEKREYLSMYCPKCETYLADCLIGTSVMCPKCGEWQDVEKETKEKQKSS